MQSLGSTAYRISLVPGQGLFESCLALPSGDVRLHCCLTHVYRNALTLLHVQPRALAIRDPHCAVFGRSGTSAGTRTVQDTYSAEERAAEEKAVHVHVIKAYGGVKLQLEALRNVL